MTTNQYASRNQLAGILEMSQHDVTSVLVYIGFMRPEYRSGKVCYTPTALGLKSAKPTDFGIVEFSVPDVVSAVQKALPKPAEEPRPPKLRDSDIPSEFMSINQICGVLSVSPDKLNRCMRDAKLITKGFSSHGRTARYIPTEAASAISIFDSSTGFYQWNARGLYKAIKAAGV